MPLLHFFHLVIFLAVFSPTNVFGNAAQPLGDSTGAPGHETCAACHTSPSGSGNVNLRFSGETEYHPGQTYTINVIISDPDLNGGKAGFSMVARDVENNTKEAGTIGEWILEGTNGIQQFGADDDLQVGHDVAGSATGDESTYTVKWKAPPAGIDGVRFYVAAVAAVGEGNDSGLASDDRVYTDQRLLINEVLPPQTIVVTETGDGGAGTLRQAVADATPGSTIIFDATLEGETITLAGSQILLNEDLTINASSLPGGITISGGNLSRVFEVTNGATIIMDSLTITGGATPPDQSGGGVLNSGNLTVLRSTITQNSASQSGGGIGNTASGTLSIVDSVLSRNSAAVSGGGVRNSGGTIIISDTRISDNTTGGSGGGIWTQNSADLRDNVIEENAAAGGGGGIYSSNSSIALSKTTLKNNTAASGGGIYIDTGTSGLSASIDNSTFVDNSATPGSGGGIFSDTLLTSIFPPVSEADTTINHCTFVDNTAGARGGAVFNVDGLTSLNHCTISSNTAEPGLGSGIASYGDSLTYTRVFSSIISANTNSDINFVSGATDSFLSIGNNLIGSGPPSFSSTGDLVGISTPFLGPLCDNGGPTLTMRPLPGSPAINAGSTSGLTEDQRGFPRSVGVEVDIGAVESERVSFDLEWSGASFGNSATATGRITFEPTSINNPGTTRLGPLVDLAITVSGSSDGNGHFQRGDFRMVDFYTGDLALDFSTELVGQPTDQDPWGTTQPGDTGGDFNLFRAAGSPNAPEGTYWFVLTTSGLDDMLLTSFRPASGPPPANSLVHPLDLQLAFDSRDFLVDSPGAVTPTPVVAVSDGGTEIWEWTPQVDAWFDINTFGSTFDTRLTVYEGTTAESLVWLAGNDDAFPGEFSSDHPQPDRSAVVIPLSAGKTYQFAIEGGVSGTTGGTLEWQISRVDEPLPPAVETRTHFPFDFLTQEYEGGTALIDTIVPVGDFGKPEPYVHVLDTRSAVWNTVVEVDGDVEDGPDISVTPILGGGASLRTADAVSLSFDRRLSTPLTGGFTNPTSETPGPFVTVASARYPHRFGTGHQSICVDLRAEGGQGYGLTHMPLRHLDDASKIRSGNGGLQVAFQWVGNKPPNELYGYTLKDAKGNPIDSLTGEEANELYPNLEPGEYSISFNAVPGYRIAVSREGVGEPDLDRANINLTIPSVIEEGTDLVNRRREMCIFFPNSVDCTHFVPPVFEPPHFLAASGCDVREDMVTVVTVQYIELATGKDIVGYINVPDPNKVLDDADVTGGELNPLVQSTLLNLSNDSQTVVLAMLPDDDAPAGRVIRWKKTNGGPYDSYWVKWRNFVSLGRNFPSGKTPGQALCFDCHTHVFDSPPNTMENGVIKPGGGEPRVPWFKPIGGNKEVDSIAERLIPSDPEPFTLAILNRPFDNGLNFRMPIDIEANGVNMPARRTWVEYANQRWEILQAAGSNYDPIVTLNSGNQITLNAGSKQHTVSFNAQDEWLAEAIDSPWIHIMGPDEGFAGPGSIRLRFDPNPGSRPRTGIIQIEDVFYSVTQLIEPPEIVSLNPLTDPKGFSFRFKALNGVTYELEHSTTLAPGSWAKLDDAVGERADTEMTLDAEFPVGPPRGYYRIRSVPAE